MYIYRCIHMYMYLHARGPYGPWRVPGDADALRQGLLMHMYIHVHRYTYIYIYINIYVYHHTRAVLLDGPYGL